MFIPVQNTPSYRNDIDALRGLAVALVVLFHAFPAVFPGGYIGVDVFFVISGYLITSLIRKEMTNGQFSLVQFYIRRIRRIFPALITVVLTTLGVGYLILFPDEFQQLGLHAAAAFTFLLNFVLMGEAGYFDVQSHYKPLLHLWTLSIEEQFYVFWPLLLLILFKMRLPAIWVISLIVGLSFAANLYFVDHHPDLVFFHTGTRVWELGLGGLLAYLGTDRLRSVFRLGEDSAYVLGFTGIIMILWAALFIPKDYAFPGLLGLLPTLGAVLFITAHARRRHWFGLTQLGLVSYPLYLWHWAVFSLAAIYLGQTPSADVMICLIVISVLLSVITVRYVEVLRYMMSQKVVIFLIGGAVFGLLAGAQIYKANGMPGRGNLDYLETYKLEFDRTQAVDETCRKYVDAQIGMSTKFGYCRAQFAGGNKDVLGLLGDSHAHAAFPGFAKVAAENNFDTVMVASSSCPPLEGFLWGRNPKEVEDCKVSIDHRLTLFELDDRIKMAALFVRGPTYMHGEPQRPFTSKTISENFAKVTAPGQGYEDYFDGMRATLERLNSIDRLQNIYVYLENPELDFLPKEIVPRPFDRRGLSLQDRVIERKLYEQRMAKYWEYMAATVAGLEKIKVIDARPYFCNDKNCFAFKNGDFLYADDDHYSVAGSLYLAQATEEILFGEKH